MKHLFFNCQTLGRHPGCAIVEVGFALFSDLEVLKDEQMGAAEILFPVEQNLLAGLHTEKETMKWWLEKQGGLRPNLRNEKRPHATVPQLLSELASQWDHLWHTEMVRNIWCKYPTFHVAILNRAFDECMVERPILLREENFRSWNCASTMIQRSRYHLPYAPRDQKFSLSKGTVYNLGEATTATRALTEAKDGAYRLSHLFRTFKLLGDGFNEATHLKIQFDEAQRLLTQEERANKRLANENARLRKSKTKARRR